MARDPNYDPYLDFNSSFRWGGREWTLGDLERFKKMLGPKKYEQWARRHKTAARVFDPIEQLLYKTYHPQLRSMQEQQRQQEDFYRRQLVDIAGFMNAIQGTLGDISPAIRKAFTEGGQALDVLGKGYGGALNADQAQASANTNEALRSIGAPEGQMQQPGDVGNVLAGLAGWLPKEMLNAQGNAWGQWADTLGSSARLEAELMGREVLDAMNQSNKEYQGSIRDILAGLPGDREELRQGLLKQKMDERKQSLNELKEQHDWLMQQAAYANAVGDDKRAQEYLDLAHQREQRIALAQQGMAPDGSLLPGYYRDKNGNILQKGTRINNKGEIVGIPTGGKGGKGGTFDERHPGRAEVKKVAGLQTTLDSYIKSHLFKENPNLDPNAPETVPSKTYKEAYHELWARFSTGIATKQGKKALQTAILAALKAAGYVKEKPPASRPPGGGPK